MTTHRDFAGQIDTGSILYQYPYFCLNFSDYILVGTFDQNRFRYPVSSNLGRSNLHNMWYPMSSLLGCLTPVRNYSCVHEISTLNLVPRLPTY
jgi:hypothetical protein